MKQNEMQTERQTDIQTNSVQRLKAKDYRITFNVIMSKSFGFTLLFAQL